MNTGQELRGLKTAHRGFSGFHNWFGRVYSFLLSFPPGTPIGLQTTYPTRLCSGSLGLTTLEGRGVTEFRYYSTTPFVVPHWALVNVAFQAPTLSPVLGHDYSGQDWIVTELFSSFPFLGVQFWPLFVISGHLTSGTSQYSCWSSPTISVLLLFAP